MNIIEAIKTGKDFKRKDWWDGYFLYVTKSNKGTMTSFRVRSTNQIHDFEHEDIFSNDWEVKEDGKMTFDPTKPVQTEDGRKARIICTDFKGSTPIIALIEVYDNGDETYERYNTDGTHPYKSSNWNLINIPEPNTIDIHVGGVYKTKHGDICVLCGENDDGTNYFQIISKCKWTPPRFIFIDPENILENLEHLGDIQDLNSYIKDKLK